MSEAGRKWSLAPQIEGCRGWFKNHRASLEKHGPVEILRWREPGSGIFAVNYTIGFRHGLLAVDGDIGEAIYRWNADLKWPFLTGCSLGYFAEKCKASETGHEFRQWYPQKAQAEIHEHEYFFVNDSPSDFPAFNKNKNVLLRAAGSSHEWDHALHDLNEGVDGVEAVLGYDWVETWPEVGYDHHLRLIGHWLGLRMAWEQLQAGKEAP